MNKLITAIARFLKYDLLLCKTDLLTLSEKIYILTILKIKYILRFKSSTARFFSKKWQGDSLYNLLAIEAYIYQIETIRKIIKPSRHKVIFDVGAHIGTYSMLLKRAYLDSKIFCFEPNPITYSLLKKNLTGINDIETYNIGFSNKDTLLKIYYKKEGLDSATFESKEGKKRNNTNVIECRVKTLNSFIDELSINHIDILKIDVEGHEKKLLSSAPKALSITKYLIMEVSLDFCTTFSEVIKLLSSASYNFTLLRIIKIWENENRTIAIIELLFENKYWRKNLSKP